MTVVRSKSRGVQMNGDHMFWGTSIMAPPDSEASFFSIATLSTMIRVGSNFPNIAVVHV